MGAGQAGRRLQPSLHEVLTALRAPTVALSSRDGQIRDRGAEGVFHADVRVLARAVLTVAGAEPEHLAGAVRGASTIWSAGLCRLAGDEGPDPTIRVDRVRTVEPGRVGETIALVSTARLDQLLRVEITVAADLFGIAEVKAGNAGAAVPVTPDGAGALSWSGQDVSVTVRAAGAQAVGGPSGGMLGWDVELAAGSTVEVAWTLEVVDHGGAVRAGHGRPLWSVPQVHSDDRRLEQVVQQGLDDLDGLRMATVTEPESEFLAAGSPWYFTLFGRDSIWAARLLLPLGTDIARGTLRTLAARQGTVVDPATGEAPGKILHELRRTATEVEGGHADSALRLPPVYYGTVDATPLWILLLRDAWRAGMAAADVEPLLDACERALEWLATDGDPDGDGFLEYVDSTGSGLANQGWKDSADAVRFADGSRARPPIALCEVQAYAVAAALAGAELLDAFGRPGADRWRDFSANLTARFRRSFWVADADGAYPAIALDGEKRRVDTLTSNIGHLLATGILDAAETAEVVRRLTGPDLDSGFGLRTMSIREQAYSPLSYHCGSVWAHDTAIVALGMSRAGHGGAAAPFVEGLLAAGAAFDGRLPELYSGDARANPLAGAPGVPVPVPYPASCRPQAWSAAAGVALLSVVLGLEIDVPAGTVTLRPLRPSPVGRLHVSGLAAGAALFDVEIDAAGTVLAPTAASVEAAGLRLIVG